MYWEETTSFSVEFGGENELLGRLGVLVNGKKLLGFVGGFGQK